MSAPPKRRERSVRREAITLIALVVVVAGFFGWVILPKLAPPKSALEGQLAPEFVLPVMTGGEPGNRIRLSDLRGKAVVLDFWASWCAPCRAQAPIIDQLDRRYGEEVVFLGVNTSDSQADAVRFARERELSYTTLADDEGEVRRNYGVQALPTLVVIDPSGRITAVRTRVVREPDLAALVDGALAAKTSAAN